MTLKIRRDDQISDVDGGWFRARWHYSFDTYVDPEYTSFGTMRVFNDDRLVPGAVWPMHPHRDIEGLTYVVEGSFRHEDDVGGPPGPLPAGLGPAHDARARGVPLGAERLRDRADAVHPDLDHARRTRPAHPASSRRSSRPKTGPTRLLKAISGDGGDAVLVHQDAHVFVSRMNAGRSVEHPLAPGRGAYLYVIEGDVGVNGERMETGSAAQITDEERAEIAANSASELILVDVALG